MGDGKRLKLDASILYRRTVEPRIVEKFYRQVLTLRPVANLGCNWDTQGNQRVET